MEIINHARVAGRRGGYQQGNVSQATRPARALHTEGLCGPGVPDVSVPVQTSPCPKASATAAARLRSQPQCARSLCARICPTSAAVAQALGSRRTLTLSSVAPDPSSCLGGARLSRLLQRAPAPARPPGSGWPGTACPAVRS